jgi:hypothetical protein
MNEVLCRLLGLGVLVLSVGACGGSGGGGTLPDGGSSSTTTDPETPDASVNSSSSATVGPEGGTIRLDGGVVILVPPGAVDTETTIELEVLDPDDLDASIPSDVEAEGSAISLSAEDVEFSTPVHVTIPRPPGTNVVLWLADGSDEWLIVENVALGDSTFTFATIYLGVFLVGSQAPPSYTANIVPFICTAFGVVESGAADSYSVDYLCQEDGKSYHSLASRFPDLYDLEDLADTVGRGLIDLNIDEGAEPYGIAYGEIREKSYNRLI